MEENGLDAVLGTVRRGTLDAACVFMCKACGTRVAWWRERVNGCGRSVLDAISKIWHALYLWGDVPMGRRIDE